MQFTKCPIVCALILSAALIVTSVSSAHAQVTDTSKTTPAATGQTLADTNPVRSVGGFVDAYYAWDFNRPHNFDRAYTTQPARHAEANVNLAYIETKWSGSRYYTPTKAVTLTYDKAARELPDDRRLHWNRCEPPDTRTVANRVARIPLERPGVATAHGWGSQSERCLLREFTGTHVPSQW